MQEHWHDDDAELSKLAYKLKYSSSFQETLRLVAENQKYVDAPAAAIALQALATFTTGGWGFYERVPDLAANLADRRLLQVVRLAKGVVEDMDGAQLATMVKALPYLKLSSDDLLLLTAGKL